MSTSNWIELGLFIVAVLSLIIVVVKCFWLRKEHPDVKVTFDKSSNQCLQATRGNHPIVTSTSGIKASTNAVRNIYRLKIENKGGIAKNVKIKVDDAVYADGKGISEFNQPYLRWVKGGASKDIVKNETDYINFCSHIISLGIDMKPPNDLFIERSDFTDGDIKQEFNLEVNDVIFTLFIHGDNFKSFSKKFIFIKPTKQKEFGTLQEIVNSGDMIHN